MPDDEIEPEQPTTIIAPVADSSTEEGVSKQRRKRVTVEQKRTEFWRGIMATPADRERMWEFLCLASSNPFITEFGIGPNGAPQAEASWFHAGKKAKGEAQFLFLLHVCRAETLLMVDENSKIDFVGGAKI